MKIAIIGAGVAGIVSLKYALEKGHECDCFEETGEFGGTWVYTDESGIDENGRKIYRTMYKDLITNLPKDVMVFMDFLYPQHINESYITQKQVLQYLTDYVTKFKLDSRIKFHQMVSKVRPLSDTKWNVTSTDLTNLTENSSQYDAVFVCSGIKMHSSEYRNPTIYKDKRVLLIGASYSAIDVANQIKNVTKSMFLSHWKPINFKLENVSNKPAVEEFHSKSAAFIDGTTEEIDIVIFCTGFEYKFPFLEEECGITVDDNCVRPLFKHIINIQHPTMFFIGIPFLVPAFLTCDLHARFSLAVLENKHLMPPRQDMLKDLDDYISTLKLKKIPQRHFHKIGLGLREHFSDLIRISLIKPFPPVLTKLYMHKVQNPGKEKLRYVILDDENYTTSPCANQLI